MLARQQRLIWRRCRGTTPRACSFQTSSSLRLPRATDSRPGSESEPQLDDEGSGKVVGPLRSAGAPIAKVKGLNFIPTRPPGVPSRGKRPIAAPPPPPKPELPSAFTSAYLTRPPSPEEFKLSTSQEFDPEPYFIDTLHGQLLSSFLPKNQLTEGPDPTIAVVCPHEGGEYIVRRTIEAAAGALGADVLRIDAIEMLGLAEWGSLGAAGSAIQLADNPLHIVSRPSSLEDSTPDQSAMFARPPSGDFDEPDAGPESIHITPAFSVSALPFPTGGGNAMQGGGGMPGFGVIMADSPDSAEQPALDALFEAIVAVSSKPVRGSGNRRIIYVQDASAMASTFTQWWPSLQRAVRARRRSGVEGGDEVKNPTTIVLGLQPSLLHTGPNIAESPQIGPKSEVGGMGLLESIIRARGGRSPSGRDEGLGEMWHTSEEDDVRGRHVRLARRLSSFKPSDETSLRRLIPPFNEGSSASPQGNPEERSFGLADFLSSIRGAGKQTPLTPLSSGKPDDVSLWQVLGTLPRKRNVRLEKEERVARRTMINQRLLARAVGQRGGDLVDLDDEAHLANQVPETAQQEKGSLLENFGTSVWPLSTLEHLAAIAVAHVLRGSATVGSDIGWSAIAEASVREEEGDRLAQLFTDRVRAVQKLAAKQFKQETREEPGSKPKPKQVDDLVVKLRKDKSLSQHEKRLLDCIVDRNKVESTKFEDVILPDETIDGIRSVVSIPILFPEAYRKGILANHSTSGVLMFGPPGTGKSLAARALASESGARMLALNPSDLFDAYVGVSQKLVHAAFSLARRLSPAIIFIDECDSLFGGRSGGSAGGAHVERQILGEMLQAMDGLTSASENRENNVVVIAATNRPYDLDKAMLRRLPRRVLIDLPNQRDRQKILRSLLGSEYLAKDIDLEDLAKRTDTYSGSDLKHVCVNAALAALKETLDIPWKTRSSGKPIAQSHSRTSEETPHQGLTDTESVAPVKIDAPDTSPGAQPLLIPEVTLQGSEGPVEDASMELEVSAMRSSQKDLEGKEASANSEEVDEYPEPEPQPTKAQEKPESSSSAPADRILYLRHFDIALKEITPSSSEQGNLTELRKWADQYGEGGTKRGRTGAYGAKFGFGGLNGEGKDDPGFGRVRPEE